MVWTSIFYKLLLGFCVDGSCRVTSVVVFGFYPKILVGGGALWMVLCHFTNADWVVGALKDGGNTETLPALIKFIQLFTCRGGGDAKTSSPCLLLPLVSARTPMQVPPCETFTMSQCLSGSGCSKDQENYDWTTAMLSSITFINSHFECTQFVHWISSNV